ncbi:MAG TPA: cysteine desulfurase-like protein [Solirubrobacteraceae bacterium]|nr:cysteine desulfurase-like protein [Solirubrobacteraceae bacterium]
MYDVAALRARIPALNPPHPPTAFFDGPGGSQTPAEVAQAIAAALTAPLANRGTINRAAQNAEDIVVGARRAVADLLGTDARGVVFGRSMTQLAYDFARVLAAGWGPGDEVVVTRLDHDGHIRPWVQAAERAGAQVRWADFDPDTGELTAGDIAAQLTGRTRLVAVTGASNLIGTRPPLAEIAQLAHDRGALFSVDAVHLTAHAPIDRREFGADLLFCSPYKFLGPHCGVLAADPALLETLHPDKLAPSTDDVPERFEYGTLPYEMLAGVTAAVDVIASLAPDSVGAGRRERVVVGMEQVEEHEDALRAELEHGLASVPGITQRARASRRTPTLLLTFDGRDAAAVADTLAEQNINAPADSFYAMEASRRLGLGDAGGMRVGLAPYTDQADIQRLLDALQAAVKS